MLKALYFRNELKKNTEMDFKNFIHLGLIPTIFIILGIILVCYGAMQWYQLGFPLNNFVPYQLDFGSNPIHFLLLGLLFVIWAVFHAYLHKKI